MRLREFRVKKWLTLNEFAALVGCNAATICQIELGRALPSFKIARKILKAFEIEVEEIDEIKESQVKALLGRR